MFKLEFDTKNSAMRWEDEGDINERAVADILSNVASQVKDVYLREGTIADNNGNPIGKWSLTDD